MTPATNHPSPTTHSPITVANPDTPEWHQARMTGIGASEAAAAAGLSRYCTPLELYHRKRGNLPPVQENTAMRLGKALEPVVIQEWCLANGVEPAQYPVPMVRHREHAFVLATPDCILSTGELLECKTSSAWMLKKLEAEGELGEQGTDALPAEWLCQAQQQLAVTDLAVCWFAVLVDGRTLREFCVERNRGLIDALIAAEADLWARIESGEPPEPDFQHESTPDLIRDLFRSIDESRTVELSRQSVYHWERYDELGDEIKALEKERKAHKAAVLAELGDAYAGLLPGTGRMVRRQLRPAKSFTVNRGEYIDVRCVKQKEQA